MENSKCRICGNEKGNSELSVMERTTGNGEKFKYLQCGKCGCVMLNEKIDNLDKWYSNDYNPYHKRIRRNETYISCLKRKIRFRCLVHRKGKIGFEKELHKNGMDILLKRMYGTKLKKSDRIIDIGCGDGHWLDYLYEMGYTNVTGVDLFVPREQLQGIKWKFMKGDIYTVTGKYDWVILNHSLEHMEEQQKVLDKVKALLDKNGHALISVPLAGGDAYCKYKENFVQFDAPRHIYLHTVKSMSLLCRRADLRIERILYDSTAGIFAISDLFHKTNLTLEQAKKRVSQKVSGREKWSRMAEKSNSEGRGDQAVFYIAQKDEKSI